VSECGGRSDVEVIGGVCDGVVEGVTEEVTGVGEEQLLMRMREVLKWGWGGG
jgi:hypothetical protein